MDLKYCGEKTANLNANAVHPPFFSVCTVKFIIHTFIFHFLSLSASLLFVFKGKEKFLAILHRHMEIHGTVYYEAQRPPEVPAFVKNHGLLPQQELQQLLRKAKVRLQYRHV